MKRLAALAAVAAATSACASGSNVSEFAHDAIAVPGVAFSAAARAPGAAAHAAREAAAPPAFAPVGTPAALTGGEHATMPQPPTMYVPASAPNSLWRAGENSFFNDQRASRIGDILTVDIEVQDKAELSNSSNRSRSASTSAGLTNFFGLQELLGDIFGGGFDTTNLISGDGSSEHTGDGAINREEKIELHVAAVIVDRLPNGNFVIAGRQQMMINAELRELTISGVIRPEDISADNTIQHDKIAEARVYYGGEGQLSAVQRPNYGQRISDAIAPF